VLTKHDLDLLLGATIANAEFVKDGEREVLLLHLAGGGMLTIAADADGLTVGEGDRSSPRWRRDEAGG
jgi:hypothetical protein